MSVTCIEDVPRLMTLNLKALEAIGVALYVGKVRDTVLLLTAKPLSCACRSRSRCSWSRRS